MGDTSAWPPTGEEAEAFGRADYRAGFPCKAPEYGREGLRARWRLGWKKEQAARGEPPQCDDTEVMRLWRESGLPEYFLGNGGTNHKLVDFAKRIAASVRADAMESACGALAAVAIAANRPECCDPAAYNRGECCDNMNLLVVASDVAQAIRSLKDCPKRTPYHPANPPCA